MHKKLEKKAGKFYAHMDRPLLTFVVYYGKIVSLDVR